MIDLMQKCSVCIDKPYLYVKLTEHSIHPWTIVDFRCKDCGSWKQYTDVYHDIKEYEALDK